MLVKGAEDCSFRFSFGKVKCLAWPRVHPDQIWNSPYRRQIRSEFLAIYQADALLLKGNKELLHFEENYLQYSHKF